MSHTVGQKAALAVKNSTRKPAAVETRTPGEIIRTLRNNLTNTVTIMKTDVAVLMVAYDDVLNSYAISHETRRVLTLENEALKADVARLNEKLEEFRSVYESENSSMTFKAERVIPSLANTSGENVDINADQ